MHHLASSSWNRSNSRDREKMLVGIGIHERTLTFRQFHDLPAEVIIDLNYSVSKNNAPTSFSETSPPRAGRSVLSGFTLVELLAVVTILASIAGLGFQAMADAPEFARQHQHLFFSPAPQPDALLRTPPPSEAQLIQVPAVQGDGLVEFVK